ncbi:MAG: hypothetical protein KAX55_06310 [Propionivibrio sp.]|nr:hypothetical protein [Propionivibrio sp.]
MELQGSQRSSGEQRGESPSSAAVQVPAIKFKRDGSIGGIGEKFAANPVTGTGSMSVPIATSPGRSGFGPQLSLTYDSGAGNGPFGFGWSLSLPSITRKTEKGLPKYLDGIDSDVFILSGAEDLVPVPVQDASGEWVRDDLRTVDGKTYRIRRYCPRIEGLFARIERWSRIDTPADVHWRSISRDNILTIYGLDDKSRILDPLEPARIFSWLISESRDDKGNGIRYLYKAENGDYQPREGQSDPQTDPFSLVHQANRGATNDVQRTAQRYLHRVLYGNRVSLLDAQGRRPCWLSDLPHPPTDECADWLFEVRFDYGELDEHDPAGKPEKTWFYRADAFSSYRAGFELRTCRRCERVLILHHIPARPEELGRPAQAGYDGVVRSTEFDYDDELDPQLATRPIYSFLKCVVQKGWRQSEGTSIRSRLPPLEFEYSKPIVQDVVEEVDLQSLENLPIGLDGAIYRCVDLDGKGIPDILAECGPAWYRKRNLSPLPTKGEDGREVHKASFGPLETVAQKPNMSLRDGAEFMDLAGDGQPDVVMLTGPTPGFCEHDGAEGWQPFRPFRSFPNRDLKDPNLRLIDLDGDGRADLFITEQDAFIWQASMAEDGFGPAQRIAKVLDEEKGPRVVFADGTQTIYLADLSGDGLTDIVRIRNGEVCYWPNLGYCRFGAKITMDNSPWFDNPDQFDHKRIRLADIDGSGTTDIIYLHRDGVRLYFNQSGNGWSQPQTLKAFPRIDDVVSIMPLDLLGNGTACLVWSSPLPGDAGRPMRYVNLMGGTKPHLLIRTINNLGAETQIDYAPSTKFYLQDERDGKPWITRLPFPVHVVERVETKDYIGRNRFATRYAYHHGYFDGEEREFRGFGRVDQWDVAEIAAVAHDDVVLDWANQDPTHSVPAVRTTTWFHSGAFLGGDLRTQPYAGEYYVPPASANLPVADFLLDDTVLPDDLSPEEAREACRALKGAMLRQEVYAEDDSSKAAHPYTVLEQNFSVRLLQPRGTNPHAIFFTHAREALTFHYERNPSEPRIQHALTLEVDDYGNVLRSLAIGYGRLGGSDLPAESDPVAQTRSLITYTQTRMASDPQTRRAIDTPEAWRTPLPAEVSTWELTGFIDREHPTLTKLNKWCADQFAEIEAAEVIDYHVTPDDATKQKRLIERVRTLYRSDELTRLLPIGELPMQALPGESYQLAFTDKLLKDALCRDDAVLLQDVSEVLPVSAGPAGAADRGAYVELDGDGCWWVPSGRTYYHPQEVDAAAESTEARKHFFLPRRYRDPFQTDAVPTESIVTFDAHDLLMVETRDALGNRVKVEANDYRVLQPRLVSDPNRNQTEVAYDALGLVVGTAVMGKPLPATPEGDSLDGFKADLSPDDDLVGFFDVKDPTVKAEALLQKATTRIVYDLDRFRRTRNDYPDHPEMWQPACAATIARETHVHSPLPPQGLKFQLTFSYTDGFGREVQKKIQAEAGAVPQRDDSGRIIVGADGQPVMTSDAVSPRWVGSGWTIFNNKGKPVRQYEPFFTNTHRFEFDVRIGVSPVLFYDPAERVIATLHPNHTYEKVVFDPWQQTTWDVNDTCAPRNQQTGDPRTDPDIAGYVAAYFKGLPADPAHPWKTWFEQRSTGALGQDERNAAERTAAHADTRTTAHFDALGRPFLTVARNRVVCHDRPLDYQPDQADETVRTRTVLDIEGNQREVFDALGRVVMRYTYDMLGHRIRQQSMEAGARWMLNDVAGKPIRAWDSRGHNFTTHYDALRRPTKQYVRGTFSDPGPLEPNSDPRTLNRDILVDKIEYGETVPNADEFNLRTRIYRHFDSAGLAISARLDANGDPTEAYDFKGNLLCSTRRLVSDYKGIPDWSQPAEPQLESESFVGSTRYDALNRPIQSIAPHSSLGRGKINVIQPVFNEANLLERVDVWLEHPAEPAGLLNPAADVPSPVGVADIDYDAKGQRTLIDYKTRDATVIRTTYTYDRETFRLTHLYTRRGVNPATAQGVAFTDDCDNPNPPPATIAAPEQPPTGKGCGLQNLHYTYDPAGNITHIRDDAQQPIFFKNTFVEPSNDYVYDALYRLIQATGREHLGQGDVSISHSYNDARRTGIFSGVSAGRFSPNDRSAMGIYTERYVYDAVGNFKEMQHQRTDSAVQGWKRVYEYGEKSLLNDTQFSNRLSVTTVGNAAPETYTHDAHGNMLGMPQLQQMLWDYKDQLRLSCRQRVNAEDIEGEKHHGEQTYYVYDASGQRVRKVTELANGGLKEERTYLGGFEVFRSYDGAADARTLSRERETLHMMDDKQRIALVETRTLPTTPDPKDPLQLIRYQFGNHLGSSSLELDEQAQIISYEEYAPYGSTTYQAVRSATEVPKRYRYTGKERDEESGFYYHVKRYCVSWIGRWTSCDPLGIADGVNVFAYVRNNPVKYADPTGKQCDPTIATCPELMGNWSYSEPVPNRSSVGHNVQRDHPIQVSLRAEQRGRTSREQRAVSSRRAEMTVLVETGTGYFHTEVGRLQAEINERVRAGLIRSESELIEATREAYRLAAQATKVKVNAQALDRAIVSNLAVLSETAAQTAYELRASGVTVADYPSDADFDRALSDPKVSSTPTHSGSGRRWCTINKFLYNKCLASGISA